MPSPGLLLYSVLTCRRAGLACWRSCGCPAALPEVHRPAGGSRGAATCWASCQAGVPRAQGQGAEQVGDGQQAGGRGTGGAQADQAHLNRCSTRCGSRADARAQAGVPQQATQRQRQRRPRQRRRRGPRLQSWTQLRSRQPLPSSLWQRRPRRPQSWTMWRPSSSWPPRRRLWRLQPSSRTSSSWRRCSTRSGSRMALLPPRSAQPPLRLRLHAPLRPTCLTRAAQPLVGAAGLPVVQPCALCPPSPQVQLGSRPLSAEHWTGLTLPRAGVRCATRARAQRAAGGPPASRWTT